LLWGRMPIGGEHRIGAGRGTGPALFFSRSPKGGTVPKDSAISMQPVPRTVLRITDADATHRLRLRSGKIRGQET